MPEEVLRHLPPLRQVLGAQDLIWMGVVELVQPQGPRTTTRGPTTADELASTTMKSSARATQQPFTHLSSAMASGKWIRFSRHVTVPTSCTLIPIAVLSCKGSGRPYKIYCMLYTEYINRQEDMWNILTDINTCAEASLQWFLLKGSSRWWLLYNHLPPSIHFPFACSSTWPLQSLLYLIIPSSKWPSFLINTLTFIHSQKLILQTCSFCS